MVRPGGEWEVTGMSQRRLAIDEACKPNVTLDEVEAETEVDAEAVNRALEFLARWAVRHGWKGW